MEREFDMSDVDASWYPGFLKAVGAYLVNSDYEFPLNMQYRKSARSEHFTECGIKEVTNFDHDVTEESVFDTFDPDRSRATSIMSAVLTCNCGEHKDERFSVEATMSEIIWSVTNPV